MNIKVDSRYRGLLVFGGFLIGLILLLQSPLLGMAASSDGLSTTGIRLKVNEYYTDPSGHMFNERYRTVEATVDGKTYTGVTFCVTPGIEGPGQDTTWATYDFDEWIQRMVKPNGDRYTAAEIFDIKSALYYAPYGPGAAEGDNFWNDAYYVGAGTSWSTIPSARTCCVSMLIHAWVVDPKNGSDLQPLHSAKWQPYLDSWWNQVKAVREANREIIEATPAYIYATGPVNVQTMIAMLPVPVKGSLSIQKSVTGPDADKDKKFSFTVSFKGTKAPAKRTFTLSQNDGEYVIDDIPAGVTATVSEVSDPLYTLKTTNLSTTIEAGKRSNITVTNERKTGSLSIYKSVAPASEKSKEFSVRVVIKDLGGKVYDTQTVRVSEANSPRTISGIPSGYTWEITELDVANYEVNYSNKSGTIHADITSKVSINNIHNGYLMITKGVTD